MPVSKSIAIATLLGAASMVHGQNPNDCYNLGNNLGWNDCYNDVCNSALSAIIKKEPYNPNIIGNFVIGVSNPSTGWHGCDEGLPQ